MTMALRRLAALVKKEARQMLRAPQTLAVGLLLPGVLILLFGYGLSFDIRRVPLALVLADRAPAARAALAGLDGSNYFAPVWVESQREAEHLFRAGTVEAIVQVPSDFSRRLANSVADVAGMRREPVRVQLVLNGTNATTAQALEGYLLGALAVPSQPEREGSHAAPGARVEVQARLWFNPAGVSAWYLVPGLLVLVLTLIGAFLTSLLIAREWEHGTLEALFVTPVRPLELLLAKLVPYLVVGAIDLAVCLLAAHSLFAVPLRGSLWVIVVTALQYLTVSLLLGLTISGLTRNQFLASQVALLVSFLPALMLSGLVFDLRNVPVGVQWVSQMLPATHYMALAKTLFLAGNDWGEVVRTSALLAGYTLLLGAAAWRSLRKTLR